MSISSRISPDPGPGRGRRLPVAGLKPLDALARYARVAPGAEKPAEAMARDFAAGRPESQVVVAEGTQVVLYGRTLLEVARAAGVKLIETTICPGTTGLDEGDLQIKAAGLHLQAVVTRTCPALFDLRLLTAEVYRSWSGHVRRRPLRSRDNATAEEWEAFRASLIKDAFGRAQRTLERDVRLLHLPVPLLAAVRRGDVPESHVEAAGKLESADVLDLARRLTGGERFADLRDDYFPPAGPRKTKRGAARAIQGCVKTIAVEAAALNGWLPLGAGDYPAARAAVAHLQAWLNVPPPAPINDVVAAAVRELGPVGGQPSAAIRGGGRAAKELGT